MRRAALAAAILLAQLLVSEAADLGDLRIPRERIPAWNPGVEGGIPDTTRWPAIDARRFGAVPDDGEDDTAAINRAITAAAAGGGGKVAYLPAGTYLVSLGTPIALKSGVVLRG